MTTTPADNSARQSADLTSVGRKIQDVRQHNSWRRLSPAQKIALFNRHMKLMREIKTAGVRAVHPNWNETRIQKEVARIYLHARS